MRTSRTFRQWSRFGRWADKSARPELVEGRAVGCSWFDRLTTSVGTAIGAQQTRPLRVRRTCDGFCDTVRRFIVPAAFLFEETP